MRLLEKQTRFILFLSAVAMIMNIANATGIPGTTIDQYDPSKADNGTTLFAYTDESAGPMVVQINMVGEIIWQYIIPEGMNTGIGPGFDAELLTNGNILIALSRHGLYEVTRAGSIIWSNTDSQVSHDADRLANGNTIYIYGDNDTEADAVVKEVDKTGSLVWSWYATNGYNIPPYYPSSNIARQGWVHANSVTRMSNSNTLISARNFNLTIEVNPAGETVWSYAWTNLYPGEFPIGYDPHEPELLGDTNLLVCLQRLSPYEVAEINKPAGSNEPGFFLQGAKSR